jgi:hypothetical protein
MSVTFCYIYKYPNYRHFFLSFSYLFVPEHDLSVGWVHVWRGKVVVNVAAVVVGKGVLELPRRPVLDVDDAAHAKLLHQRRVVTEVVQRRVLQRGTVVNHGPVG